MYGVDPFISVVKYGVLHPQVGTTTKQTLSDSTSWRLSTSFYIIVAVAVAVVVVGIIAIAGLVYAIMSSYSGSASTEPTPWNLTSSDCANGSARRSCIL